MNNLRGNLTFYLKETHTYCKNNVATFINILLVNKCYISLKILKIYMKHPFI